jgi:hypothetical protein
MNTDVVARQLERGIPDLDTARGWARRVPYLSEKRIQAMKKAGLQFSHGHVTDLATILNWMKEHPDFTVTQVYPPRVVKLAPARRGRRNGAPAEMTADKCGAP